MPKSNLILEQEDYVLPCGDQTAEARGDNQDESQYSLKRQIEKNNCYDYNHNKGSCKTPNVIEANSVKGVVKNGKKIDAMNKGFCND